MKLFELMSLGDENALGQAIQAARSNATKLSKHSDKDIQIAAKSLLGALGKLDSNVNVLRTDGYSLLNYLRQIADPKVKKRTLMAVSDALGSYDDSEGE